MEKKDNTKYDLTKEEYNKCLSRAELSIFLAYKKSQKPNSIFVIAQPGAGKTGLKSYVVNEAQDSGKLESYIEFNPDDIAIFHEYYKEILEEFPDESFAIVQRFVKPALDEYLRARAVELRTNIVQEGTLANKESYLKILHFQKNGGFANTGELKKDGERKEKLVKGNYNIDINILAVDRFESLLSSYEREQFFIDNELTPRVVTQKNHDYSYEKMLETIEEIEKNSLFDKIRVFKRGYSINRPELTYVNGDSKYNSAVEAIKMERAKNRQELLKNPNEYLQRIATLKEKAKNKEQISRLESLEQEFKQELVKEQDSYKKEI